MNIEIETPLNRVTEELIRYITSKVVPFCHTVKEVSRAEIILKDDETMLVRENKICNIKISISGGNLTVLTRTESFEKSVEEAINELYRLGKEQLKEKNITPAKAAGAGKILSTNN